MNMKRIAIALILAAPAMLMLGCQDNSDLEAEVASLKRQVAALHNGDDTRAPDARTVSGGEDIGPLLLRLERAERDLEAATKRLQELEQRPAGEDGEVSLSRTDSDVIRSEFERLTRERDEARRAAEVERRAERERQQAERMAEAARIAEENDIDFDPNDPRGSMMRIMQNPEQRARAFEVMREMGNERRLAPLNLDDAQRGEVLRIEADGRDRIRDAVANGREAGASPEQIQSEVERIRQQQENDLRRVMTPEQYEQYEASGGATGGMMGNPEDWLRMIPPGMIPGMPGSGG
jgi:hypothetical protein